MAVKDDIVVPIQKAFDLLSYVIIVCVPCSGPVMLSQLSLLYPSIPALTGNVMLHKEFVLL